ncbi:Carnosine N-methyltransferase [Chionoecetes opilio]|uniref:Carnosine N-methyltransferase n=1 Tax=Chionoecetes opilio TaxID=41210 RepID=A0A8J4XR81_CHIOP|nr:Carnosine N-methyltransferase [Chionoecetes opilio]
MESKFSFRLSQSPRDQSQLTRAVASSRGYWVNLGPLLYHFADQPGEPSIEPSFEEVKAISTGLGFEITVEDMGLHTAYTQNPQSMLKYEYRSVFFVARKPNSPS